MKKVILDADVSLYTPDLGFSDDAIVVLMASILFSQKHIDLLGISCVSGNVWMRQGVVNTLWLLDQMKIKDIPVCKGATFPLKNEFLHVPSRYVDRPELHWVGALNSWNGTPLLEDIPFGERSKTQSDPRMAEDFMIEMVSKYPGEITILANGPLTNLARAGQKDPKFFSKVKEILILGGAIDEYESQLQRAEFNFWWDPEAAHQVLKSDASITLFPLDICLKTENRREDYYKIVESNSSVSAIYQRLDQVYWDHHPKSDKKHLPIFDLITVAYMIKPSIFSDIRKGSISINCDERSKNYGVTKLKIKKGTHLSVVFDLNVQAFRKFYLDLMTKC
ncbi:MAG: nucleoside hydrolase [Bdellovibrionales bacterium]|nr:nucleoside hydrolase [Bdellovibrionales bacterium]